MMDRENLRMLGWSEALIAAMEHAENVLDLGPIVNELRGESHGVEITTDSIDVRGAPPVATHGVAAFVRS